MKHMSKAALLSQALFISSMVFARPPECRTMQFNFGPTVNYARYKFDCTPQMQGALAGLHLDFEHSRNKREFVLVRFDARWNKVKGCNTEDRIQDYRPELDFGWNFKFCWCDKERMTFTPFFGLGFIYINNDLQVHESSACNIGCSSGCSTSSTCSSSSDQNRLHYDNLYVPVGFRTNHQWSDCFSWGVMAEYRIDAWTRVFANRDCSSVCGSVKPKHRTQGVLVEVPLKWYLGERYCMDWQVKFVPLFDWNRFGRADCSGSSCCSDSCCSSSSSGCSSSSSCGECLPILTVLENCGTESGSCNIPRLTEWYVGAHLDLGIRF